MNRYFVQFVAIESSMHPEQRCAHNCDRVIQIRSRATGQVTYEVCAIEAEEMARELLEAVEEGSKNTQTA